MCWGSVTFLHEAENLQVDRRVRGNSECNFALRSCHFIKYDLQLKFS